MWHSRIGENVAVAGAFIGMPLLGMLFLAVVYYCCLEWLHDALVPSESTPKTRIGVVGAGS